MHEQAWNCVDVWNMTEYMSTRVYKRGRVWHLLLKSFPSSRQIFGVPLFPCASISENTEYTRGSYTRGITVPTQIWALSQSFRFCSALPNLERSSISVRLIIVCNPCRSISVITKQETKMPNRCLENVHLLYTRLYSRLRSRTAFGWGLSRERIEFN